MMPCGEAAAVGTEKSEESNLPTSVHVQSSFVLLILMQYHN